MIELRGKTETMGTIFETIYNEMKAVPITMTLVISICATVYILWTDHVSKADFQELRLQVQGVKCTLESDHADTELHKTEEELFELNQHIKEVRGGVADDLYYKRIDELTHRHEELSRAIERLAHTCGGPFSINE
jgi:hypothetical protein